MVLRQRKRKNIDMHELDKKKENEIRNIIRQ